MKKKVLSLILAAIMLMSALASCTTLKKIGDDEYDKGAIIDMYLASEVYDFDPQLSITDDAQLKYLSLLFEGLTTMNENGKWKKALMDNYKIEVDDGERFSILIELARTYWSDGRTVQAADFVYSWKRLLEAEGHMESASLLYDIKNAKAAKLGDVSIDDIGVAAVDTYTLQIEFEAKIDLDGFFEKLSSIALVPLREDVISRYGDVWARKTTTILTNGPFCLKEFEVGKVTRLERSIYYYLNPDKEEHLDKYVIPYRLLNTYSTGDSAAQMESYNNGTLFYNGEIALAERATQENNVTLKDVPATYNYVFNTSKSLFAKAEVRKALSMALDREAIADIVVYAVAADGFVPHKVFDTKSGTSFRSVGGAVISTSADEAGAKALLKSAGVTSGSFTITVRENEVDLAVANYAKEVWEKLGFKVTVKALGYKRSAAGDVFDDLFQDAYEAGDFDVIGVETVFQSADAFGQLSQYAAAYSGNGVDMSSENYDLRTHISGYNNADYNAIIDSAYAAYDRTERTSLLHQAETKLMEDMPVCPLFFLQSASLAFDDLSGITYDYYGMSVFNRTKLKDYMSYKAATDTAE